MMICFTIGGVRHCYFIPIYEWPIHIPKVGPGPVNYPQFLTDAALVASLHQAAQSVSDERVREALVHGATEALKALQARAGEHAEVQLEARAG